MTEQEINTRLEDISNQRNIKNIQNIVKAEDKLFSLYNRESKRIANMVMTGDVSFEDLSDITTNLNTVKTRIDEKATGIITDAVNRSAKNSMSNVKAQINVFKNILPEEIVDAEIQPEVFNQVWFELVEIMEKSEDGIELSDRIWDINQTAMDQIRIYMMEAMVEGVSFAEIYQQIKSFLLLPDVDMRTKKWREFFKEHPPGRGVYRSAFANIMRVLRTETNRAFRLGIVEYAKNRDWIYGIKFELSAAHSIYDICDEYATQDIDGLGPGIYRPETVPTNPHAHCLCHLRLIPRYDIFNIEGMGM
jgi:hypothetical protein